jgi:pimeloyl-ACP methyl ester carboxylesterase
MQAVPPAPRSLLAPFVLLAPLALAGCTDEDDPLAPPTIAWAECEGAALFECGTLVVPQEHDRPYGATFDLPVVRKTVTDPSKRIGSLVVNPGGPGGSGLELAKRASILAPPALRDRFDIVGFDPRGEASSSPAIDCTDDLGPFVALDTTPDSAAERQALIDESRALGQGCKARSGDFLRLVGTNSIVRDMDLLREALGDDKLTYLGFSYGTFLGAIYADTFPERVRGLVLDGAVDPALTGEELIEGQALGFEAELHEFFNACAADDACPLHAGGDPAAAYDAVQAAVEKAPLPAPPGGERRLGPGEFAYGVAAALYQPSRWDSLAGALALAQSGDGSALLGLSDGYVDRHDDGTYDNGTEVYYAVMSLDFVSSRDPATYDAIASAMREQAPRIGAYLPYSALPSALWPVSPWRGEGPVSATGAPPILVVGGTRDPATPYEWSAALAAQLPGGVLLTRDGDGHTSFLGGNDCISAAVVDYLVDLKLPAAGTICPD